jgi:leucyl/phenylalanyl-tRNA---protein transferase
MGEPATGEVAWYAPDPRALLPLDERFHVPRNLEKLLRRRPFEVTVDRDFEAVIRACAAPAPDRPSTWITGEVMACYVELHREGYARSVECWREGELVGGLYGVAIGGAFFGESMFSRERDASKVALVELVERLRAGRFVLLDVQFITPHLARFGAFYVPRQEYLRQLERALAVQAVWPA